MTKPVHPLTLIFYRCHLRLKTARALSALFLILFTIAYASAQASAPTKDILTSYDRFKDETTVAVSTMLEEYTVEIPFSEMQEFIRLVAGFTYRGQRLTTAPTTVRLAFQSQARGWRFGEATELRTIVDGARIDFGQMSYSQKDLGAGHVETLRLDVPVRTFLKLARSKAAELRVGSKELRLGPQYLAALSALADQLTGVATSGTVPIKRSEDQVAVPLNQSSRPAISPAGTAPSLTGSSITTSKCPIKLPQLLPLRNFRLGMSSAEVMNRFRATPPPLSRPDEVGRRSMTIALSRPQDAPGSTGLNKLIFRFFDDRLYQIEATYSVGREWNKRPMSEFAGALSRGLGVDAAWTERVSKEFVIDCGEVRLNLSIDELDDITPASARLPLATALFTIKDTTAEVQIKERAGRLRQQERQRDAQRRQVFRP